MIMHLVMIMHLLHLVVLLLTVVATVAASGRSTTRWDTDWLFYRGTCPGVVASTPLKCSLWPLGNLRCEGLHRLPAASAHACAEVCCAKGQAQCTTAQWCAQGSPCEQIAQGCWGAAVSDFSSCRNSTGWLSVRVPPPPDACAAAAFDDSNWRSITVPHDWTRENLPPRGADSEFPVLEARYGSWKLKAGDNASWASPTLDDSSWTAAEGGMDWRSYGAPFAAVNATGWYRQHISAALLTKTLLEAKNPLTLSLGIIAGADQTYSNPYPPLHTHGHGDRTPQNRLFPQNICSI